MKAQIKSWASSIQKSFPELKHTQCLEIISKSLGFRNWQVASRNKKLIDINIDFLVKLLIKTTDQKSLFFITQKISKIFNSEVLLRAKETLIMNVNNELIECLKNQEPGLIVINPENFEKVFEMISSLYFSEKKPSNDASSLIVIKEITEENLHSIEKLAEEGNTIVTPCEHFFSIGNLGFGYKAYLFVDNISINCHFEKNPKQQPPKKRKIPEGWIEVKDGKKPQIPPNTRFQYIKETGEKYGFVKDSSEISWKGVSGYKFND